MKWKYTKPDKISIGYLRLRKKFCWTPLIDCEDVCHWLEFVYVREVCNNYEICHGYFGGEYYKTEWKIKCIIPIHLGNKTRNKIDEFNKINFSLSLK
jgi:hypothetical protein